MFQRSLLLLYGQLDCLDQVYLLDKNTWQEGVAYSWWPQGGPPIPVGYHYVMEFIGGNCIYTTIPYVNYSTCWDFNLVLTCQLNPYSSELFQVTGCQNWLSIVRVLFKIMNFFIPQLQVVGFEAPLYMVFQIYDLVAHSYGPYKWCTYLSLILFIEVLYKVL